MITGKGDNLNKITLYGFACSIAAGKNSEDGSKVTAMLQRVQSGNQGCSM